MRKRARLPACLVFSLCASSLVPSTATEHQLHSTVHTYPHLLWIPSTICSQPPYHPWLIFPRSQLQQEPPANPTAASPCVTSRVKVGGHSSPPTPEIQSPQSHLQVCSWTLAVVSLSYRIPSQGIAKTFSNLPFPNSSHLTSLQYQQVFPINTAVIQARKIGNTQ